MSRSEIANCSLLIMLIGVLILVGIGTVVRGYEEKHPKPPAPPMVLPDNDIIKTIPPSKESITSVDYGKYILSWDADINMPRVVSFWANKDSTSLVAHYWNFAGDEHFESATWDRNKFPFHIADDEAIAPLAHKLWFWDSEDAERASMAVVIPADYAREWYQLNVKVYNHLFQYFCTKSNVAVAIGPIVSKYKSQAANKPVVSSLYIAVCVELPRDKNQPTIRQSDYAALGFILYRDEDGFPAIKIATMMEIEKRSGVKLFTGLLDEEDKGKGQARLFNIVGDNIPTESSLERKKHLQKRKKISASGNDNGAVYEVFQGALDIKTDSAEKRKLKKKIKGYESETHVDYNVYIVPSTPPI